MPQPSPLIGDDLRPPFVTAQWLHLIIASWLVDAPFVERYVPRGLELETVLGRSYVSLVAFEFHDARVRGLAIPWHTRFAEMNLRLYVRARGGRGVVFIREFVRSPFTAWTARTVYHEPYACRDLRSVISRSPKRIAATYTIAHKGRRFHLSAEGTLPPYRPVPDSVEERLKEHTRGYGRDRAGTPLVYRVLHAPWPLYAVVGFQCTVDFGALYGAAWASLNARPPDHVMFAVGSPVQIFEPLPLT